VEESKHGWLFTAPSNSPEKKYIIPGSDASASAAVASPTYGAAYDMEIIGDLFIKTAAAGRILKTDPDLISTLDATRVTRLNPEGGVLNRGLSGDRSLPARLATLGALPGNEITASTPDLYRGGRPLRGRRGDVSAGWSMGWKANFRARLHDGNRGRKLLAMLNRAAERPTFSARARLASPGGSPCFPGKIDETPHTPPGGTSRRAIREAGGFGGAHAQQYELIPH
jgi:alpha-L-fucosidase 2